jgi:opacity protein-like surface antigen
MNRMMKRIVLLLLATVLLAPSLFAQEWRDRGYNRARDNSFDLEPFVGYRWGGTIFSDSTNLYGHNVDLQSSAAVGVNFGIPTGVNGMKVELMVNHQSTSVGNNSGSLFTPGNNLGDFGVTYYHAGLLVPFNQGRGATPFVIVSAGMTNLDPKMSGVSSSNKFSMSAGVGVKVPINPALSIRAEVRGYYTAVGNNNGCSHCGYGYNDKSFNQGEANLGLNFRF